MEFIVIIGKKITKIFFKSKTTVQKKGSDTSWDALFCFTLLGDTCLSFLNSGITNVSHCTWLVWDLLAGKPTKLQSGCSSGCCQKGGLLEKDLDAVVKQPQDRMGGRWVESYREATCRMSAG